MPSLTDYADAIESAARLTAHWIAASTHEQLSAVPSLGEFSRCRSGYAIVAEVVDVNRGMVHLLRGGEFSPGSMLTFESVASAAQAVLQSAQELAETARRMDEEVLTRIYRVPFGEVPGAVLLARAANHMYYHGGQINYVQRLFGDESFSLPQPG